MSKHNPKYKKPEKYENMSQEAIRGAMQYEFSQGKSLREIARQFNCNHKTVSKWVSREYVNNKHKERTPKFDQKTVDKIVELAKDKTTGSDGMSSRAIRDIINDDFENNGIKKTISCQTTNRILMKNLGKPMKIRKSFFLTEKDKERRFKFTDYIIKNGIKGRDFIFTDEKYFYLRKPYNRQTNRIRLSKETRKLIKEGDPKSIELLHCQVKAKEPSVMVCGGICAEGVTSLYFSIGNMDTHAYCQVLDGFKNDLSYFKKKYIYQQDNAAPHTSKVTMEKIPKVFTNNIADKWPPHSPDLNPIEILWSFLQDELTKRKSKDLEEMKKNLNDIWHSTPKELLENLLDGFDHRIEQVNKFNGEKYYRKSQAYKDGKYEDKSDKRTVRYYIKSKRKRMQKIKFDKLHDLPRSTQLRFVYNKKVMMALKKKKLKAIQKELDFIKKIKSNIKPEYKRNHTEINIKVAELNAKCKNYDLEHEYNRVKSIYDKYDEMDDKEFYEELDYDAKYYLAGRYNASSKMLSQISTNAQSRLTELMISDIKGFGDDEDDEIKDIRKQINANFYSK